MGKQLVKAITNPMRIRILDALGGGPASPKQLADVLDVPLSIVSYHFAVLRETDCIRPVESLSDAVGDERPYVLAPKATPTRLLVQPKATDRGLAHPPAAVVQAILDEATADFGKGALAGQGHDQLGCASVLVDPQGWRDISLAVGSVLNRVATAYEESTRRLKDSGEKAIVATIAIASFESPRPSTTD